MIRKSIRIMQSNINFPSRRFLEFALHYDKVSFLSRAACVLSMPDEVSPSSALLNYEFLALVSMLKTFKLL